jgi:FAD/FMN-containing dehydrogenase
VIDSTPLIMLFNIARTQEQDAALARLTRSLNDLAHELGGRYYLPYRLHATREQFEAAYPRAREWLAKKRSYDPEIRLQNQFYAKYA